jgi:GNAT superfamily N-acetyltransferase
MALLSSIRDALLGEYALFRILTQPTEPFACAELSEDCEELTDVAELETSERPEIAALAKYGAPNAYCFVARNGSAIIGACWYWYGETYRRRNFWPLNAGEAKLVQVTTARDHRGLGVAENLIRFSTMAMLRKGFRRLYARVWHSHAASLRAFEKAGWHEIAIVIEVRPFGRKLRFVKRRGL